VALAHLRPFRAGGGTGAVIPGTAFLNLIYVLPERWGEGIGGMLLAAVIAEAAHRGCHRIALWTHEDANARAQRLYHRHGFARTGRTASDTAGQLIGEWLRAGEPCIRNGNT
jgi:GNAT superfamily N-acetyltransferase